MAARSNDWEKGMNYKGAQGNGGGGDRNVLYIIFVVVKTTVHILKVYRTVCIKRMNFTAYKLHVS